MPKLLQWREESNPVIAERANQALALVGYNEAPKGRGIRMMSIDGGGMRYVMYSAEMYSSLAFLHCQVTDCFLCYPLGQKPSD